jgi:hypothetical protein
MAKNLSDILLGVSSGVLKVTNGGTGVSTSTGTGNLVLSTSPTLVTPVLGTPASGTLSACTVDGTVSVGYITVPQNSQAVSYPVVLTDSGKHIFHSSATAHTYTIPANSSVAFPIGTVLTFINDTGSGVLSITITTDTMVWIPSGDTTATRTLAAGGMATAIKIASTKWFISGAGVS